jgi:1-acyl-sn-glycerol-3-phosphate acyltransferase
MARTLERAWRVIGTGVSFAVFGLAGLVLSLTLFPLLTLSTRDHALATRRVQAAIACSFRAFAALMRGFGLFTLDVRDAARLRRPGILVVANHPTLIDVILLAGLMPQADCIVKQALQANPFLRRAVRAAGYIINTEPDGLVDECAARLRAGRSMIIFPEGTRTPGAALGRFQRGAARVALAAGCDVVPVSIRCDQPWLRKHTRWYRVPAQRPNVTLDVGEPIVVGAVARSADPASIQARRLTRLLEQRLALGPQAPPPPPSAPGLQFT